MLSPIVATAIQKAEAQRPQFIPTLPRGIYWGGNLLPENADDLTLEQGQEVYRQMDTEPAIDSADFIMRALALECGTDLGAALDEPQDKTSKKPADVKARRDYKQADDCRQFIARAIEKLTTPLASVIWDSCSAWGNGHKLFEQVRELQTDEDGETTLFTVAIKPKPRSHYRFAVTRFMDVVGVVPMPGLDLLVADQMTGKEQGVLVSPDDLFVFSLRGENGDPRGKAAKRAAYDAWYRKKLAKPESVQHVALFGSGRISIEGPAPSRDVTPAKSVTVGGVEVSMTDYIAGQAMFIRNGSYIVLPDGWTQKDHMPGTGGSDAFEKLFDRCDREMTMAMLTVTRATQEAKHGSKADSETAEGLLSKLINWLRQSICEAVREQIFKPLVRFKFGSAIAEKFTPKLLMESADDEDIPALLTAIALAVQAGAIAPEQLPFWDRMLGQPERDPEATLKPEQTPAADPAKTQNPAKFKTAEADVEEDDPEVKKKRRIYLLAIWSNLLKSSSAHVSSLADGLASGALTSTEWANEFEAALTDAHSTASSIGQRLAGQTATATEAAALEAWTEQDSFFTSFLEDLNSGKYGTPGATGDEALDVAAIQARSMMYAKRLKGTVNSSFKNAVPADVNLGWKLGEGDHCQDEDGFEFNCPDLADEPARPASEWPTSPGMCETPCLFNCTCGWESEDGQYSTVGI